MAEPEAQHDAAQPAPPRARRIAGVLRWVERLSPWISLVLSVLGAAYMDRREEQGGLIVAGAAAAFVVLVVASLAHRPRAPTDMRTTGGFHKLVRFASVSTAQSLVQTSLYFSGPFYLEASAFTPAQCVFLALFAVAALISTWDPWSLRVMLHPLYGPALLSFASFCAWNAALPMLGMRHELALWSSAGAVSVLVPVVQLLSPVHRTRRWQVVLGGALVPLLMAAAFVRALPAAPLKVVDAGIGTGVEARALLGRTQRFPTAPPRLLCFTAIFAPRGLSDQLQHLWSRDGEPLTRIFLTVQGGRKAGFRTWSRLALPRGARGRYRCEVRTPLGQTLSVTDVLVGASANTP